MKRLVLLASAACLIVSSNSALAQPSEEKNFLSMYFSETELEVQSATRSPEPISHVAENITVVKAADIERMNAHTLADVLNTIPGVEVWMTGGPGQQAQATILGSNDRHVIVMMDGVVLNYLWSGVAEIGMIPVQNIEKIEIVKGPASSVWGSALGGFVNIITKSGRTVDRGGMLSGSLGTEGFGDFRAEVRGKQDRFGYYLTAGRLQSNDLTPHRSVSAYNAYTKISYDLTDKTDIMFALAYERSWRDDYFNDYSPDPTFAASGSDRSEHVRSTLAVNSTLANKLDLNVSVWTINQYQNSATTDLTTGDTSYAKELNHGYGTSAKLTWKPEQHTVVFGTDLESKKDIIFVLPGGEQTIRKWAVYANDTIILNKLAIIPGIRFDHISSNGDVTSPSLGIAYTIANDTIIRAYAAKGFSVPRTGDTFGFINGWIGNPDLKVETVWSYQGGVESAALKYLWMKLSVFRNDIHDEIHDVVLPSGEIQFQNIGRERREGVLIEAKTIPVLNMSLSAGAEFISATDLNTGEHIKEVPVQVYDIGIRYDDHDSFKAVLLGRHINWNATAEDMSQYHSILLDLNVMKKIYQHRDSSLEVFVNAHNLLNTAQYLMALYPNPERWYEGGVRLKF